MTFSTAPKLVALLVGAAAITAVALSQSTHEHPAEAPPEEAAPEQTAEDPAKGEAAPGRSRVSATALRKALSGPAVLEEVSLVDGPLVLLPPDTIAVLGVPSWSGLVADLGLADLVNEHRDALVDMEDGLAEAGLDLHDLLDPGSLGVDTEGPVVLAWMDVREPVAVVGVRLQDPDAFERALGVIMAAAGEGEGFRTEQLGDALVTFEARPVPRLAVVRRAGAAFVLVCEGWRGTVETAAAQLAFQDAAEGLPATEVWRETMGPVRGGDGFAFVNLEAVHSQTVLAIEASLAAAEAEAEAGEGGAEPWRDAYVSQIQASGDLAHGLLGSMRGLGFGAELARGRLDVDARVLLRPGSLVEGLLKNRSGESHLLRAMSSSPVFLLDGAVDPVALRQIAALLFAMTGQDFEAAMKIAGPAMGLEGQDPFDLLSGELGFAVMAPAEDDPDGAWGFTVVVGVTDGDAADGALDRALALGSMSGAGRHDEDLDALILPGPGSLDVYVARAGGAVLLTTDAVALHRLRSGSSSNVSSWLPRGEITGLVGSSGTAGVMLWNIDALAAAIENERGDMWAAPHAEAQSEGVDRELDDVGRRISEVYQRSSGAIEQRQAVMMRSFGSVAIAARTEGASIGGRMTWAFNADTARALLSETARHAVVIDALERARSLELEPLYERQRELWDLRRQQTEAVQPGSSVVY